MVQYQLKAESAVQSAKTSAAGTALIAPFPLLFARLCGGTAHGIQLSLQQKGASGLASRGKNSREDLLLLNLDLSDEGDLKGVKTREKEQATNYVS